MLGILCNSALDLGIARSESSVEDLILFVLAVSFSNLVGYGNGIAHGIKDVYAWQFALTIV
jgi:hypothetical protein